MSYEFPNHPGKPRPNPFQGADGLNPFADSAAPSMPTESNPYAASSEPAAAVVQPGQYSAIVPHRGGTVFWFGLTGLLASTFGSLCLLCWLPLPIFALSLTIPAWIMGRHDLRAMKVGAMDGNGRGQTRAGYVMGIIGSLVAGTLCLLIVGGFIAWIFGILSLNP